MVVLEHDTAADSFTLKELYVKAGTPSADIGPVPGAFKYEVISFDNDVLAEGHFMVHNQVLMLPSLDTSSQEDLDRYGISEEEVKQAQEHSHEEETHSHEHDGEHTHAIILPHSDVVIAAPYFDNAQKIVISKDGTQLTTISTVQFANTCGNAQCEEHESVESCEDDCTTGISDGYCDKAPDEMCDPDCRADEDLDCSFEKSSDQIAYEHSFLCNNNNICDLGEDKDNCPHDCGAYDRWIKYGTVLLSFLVALLAFYLMGAAKENRN